MIPTREQLHDAVTDLRKWLGEDENEQQGA